MKNRLLMDELLDTTRNCFSQIKDDVIRKRDFRGIPLTDCLMSGLAIFNLKYPSLLQFDDDHPSKQFVHNMENLFGVKEVPSDTYLRERLDNVSPRQLRKAYRKLFKKLQRGKKLKLFEFLDGYYLLSLDGTGYFSSHDVFCENCCVKHHKELSIDCQFTVLLKIPSEEAVKSMSPNNAFLYKHDGNWHFVFKTDSHETQKGKIISKAAKALLNKLFCEGVTKKELRLTNNSKIKKLIEQDKNFHKYVCKKTYYHQVLAGALVHPDQSVVLPFAPEPILKQDGNNKNDCERVAAKRFITDFRREHPHLKVIVVEDGLASNAPHIKVLKDNKMSFILGAKEDDHKYLFEEFNALAKDELTLKRDDTTHRFKWMNGLSLNDSNHDCKVNVLEYWETTKKGTKHFVWVTDINLSKNNVFQIMIGGRARWKIENETFNTLKNQGYHFEHNFGHGKKHLSSVFAHLMLLAFLIDQIQQFCCETFQKALKKLKKKRRLWERLRSMFHNFIIKNWHDFLNALAIEYCVELNLADNLDTS
jgi:hypothetical protein